MQGANRFARASRYPWVMPTCGHDGHTAMLLGAATHLARTRQFDGVVHSIFQRAAEGLGGARATLDDCLFERFPCEAIFGMHKRPRKAVGRSALRAGPMMAGGANGKVDFREREAPTVNYAAQAEFAAGICSALVGAENVDRKPPLNIASEDFSFMLERVPGCYINIGNGMGEGGCEVHHPGYDFNDAALPLGAAFFVRAVETKPAVV